MLREAVASALDQQGVEVTVVVVDDGSTDGTATWLGSLRDERLRVVRHEQGRGGSAARNAGLALAGDGPVLFLDDDDVLLPGALADLDDALRRHPQAAAAAGAHLRFGATDRPGRSVHPRREVVQPVWREELTGWNLPPAAVLWRAEVVRALGGWDESLRRCEDRDLNLRAGDRPVVLVPRAVMRYRIHEAQVPAHTWADVDVLVRDRFLATRRGSDARAAAAIVEAKARIDAALDAWTDGDHRAARRLLAAGLRQQPSLLRSAVIGRWLRGLALRMAFAGAAPPLARRLQRVRHRRLAGRGAA